MKHITIEMLLDAVETQSSIFEEGDTFSDDVLSYMISGGVIDASNHKYKHRELLLQKVDSMQNYQRDGNYPFTWITHCSCCGKELCVPVAKNSLCVSTSSFMEISLHPKGKITVFYNGKRVQVPYKEMLMYNNYENKVLCSECETKVKEAFKDKIMEYCSCDKISFWQEQYDLFGSIQYLQSSRAISKAIKHPYADLIDSFHSKIINGCVHTIADKLTGKNLKKEEIQKNVVHLSSDGESNILKTDQFINKYCMPTHQQATIEDTRAILLATGLNEDQLQAHLRALFYQDFVQTIYWKSIVLRRKYMDSLVCTKCGTKNNLEVHHLTYDHHGDERHHFEDLITLCHKCHEKIHKLEQINRPK